MAVKWSNEREFNAYIQQMERHTDDSAVRFLAQTGEEMVKICKDKIMSSLPKGYYTNRTYILVRSIGFIVVQDGQIKVGLTGAEGENRTATDSYLREIASRYRSGSVLIWGTGTDYASYVEAKEYDVIAGSGAYLQSAAEDYANKFVKMLLSGK